MSDLYGLKQVHSMYCMVLNLRCVLENGRTVQCFLLQIKIKRIFCQCNRIFR